MAIVNTPLEDIFAKDLPYYFNGNDANVFFNGVFVEECTSIGWRSVINSAPVYPYNDGLFNSVMQGQYRVEGKFTVNFTSVGYIEYIIKKGSEAKLPKHISPTFNPLQYGLSQQDITIIRDEFLDYVWEIYNEYESQNAYNSFMRKYLHNNYFDMLIVFGNPGSDHSTMKTIIDAQILDVSLEVAKGMPTQLVYTFIARLEDAATDYGKSMFEIDNALSKQRTQLTDYELDELEETIKHVVREYIYVNAMVPYMLKFGRAHAGKEGSAIIGNRTDFISGNKISTIQFQPKVTDGFIPYISAPFNLSVYKINDPDIPYSQSTVYKYDAYTSATGIPIQIVGMNNNTASYVEVLTGDLEQTNPKKMILDNNDRFTKVADFVSNFDLPILNDDDGNYRFALSPEHNYISQEQYATATYYTPVYRADVDMQAQTTRTKLQQKQITIREPVFDTELLSITSISDHMTLYKCTLSDIRIVDQINLAFDIKNSKIDDYIIQMVGMAHFYILNTDTSRKYFLYGYVYDDIAYDGWYNHGICSFTGPWRRDKDYYYDRDVWNAPADVCHHKFIPMLERVKDGITVYLPQVDAGEIAYPSGSTPMSIVYLKIMQKKQPGIGQHVARDIPSHLYVQPEFDDEDTLKSIVGSYSVGIPKIVVNSTYMFNQIKGCLDVGDKNTAWDQIIANKFKQEDNLLNLIHGWALDEIKSNYKDTAEMTGGEFWATPIEAIIDRRQELRDRIPGTGSMLEWNRKYNKLRFKSQLYFPGTRIEVATLAGCPKQTISLGRDIDSDDEEHRYKGKKIQTDKYMVFTDISIVSIKTIN